ncbi:MAG: helix-turn-helix domain-containing protein, partial [Alphaproteobacteria bacterium]|nr:helix-turn-helix domain-containing protein [Alphaproteobacteria bacterium]
MTDFFGAIFCGHVSICGCLLGSARFTKQVQHPTLGAAMGNNYEQLSLDERIEIYRLIENGLSRRRIAAAIGRSASTVSREIRRNAKPTKHYPGGYKPVRAHQLAARRRRWDARFKMQRQPVLRRL